MSAVMIRPLLLLLTLALAACDTFPKTTPPDPPRPSQTRVVRLTLDPDTVAVGDTTLIHVVIEDSLDTRFRYEWIGNVVPVDGRINGPRVRWVAPQITASPGEVHNIPGSVHNIWNHQRYAGDPACHILLLYPCQF